MLINTFFVVMIILVDVSLLFTSLIIFKAALKVVLEIKDMLKEVAKKNDK